MRDFMLAEYVVETRCHYVLELKNLLVLLEFSQLEKSHVSRLNINEVSGTDSQNKVKCLQVLLAIEKDLPYALVQEDSFQDTADELKEMLVLINFLYLKDVYYEDDVGAGNLDQVNAAAHPQSAFQIDP